MTAIIAYGSLIDKEELSREAARFGETYPVQVRGFKRTFHQEPTWREGDGERRAVLNVVRSEGDCLNGVLVQLVHEHDLRWLDERERGYDRVEVERQRLARFAGFHFPGKTGSVYIYTGRPDKRNEGILPDAGYLELCLSGARQWGEEFYRQFLRTTYVRELPLHVFLQETWPKWPFASRPPRPE